MTKITFSKDYIKLHGQTTAELIAVKIIDLSYMSDKDFQELVEYDCLATDGSYFPLNKDKSYCLLVFLGNKNIVFQTLRKREKYTDYQNLIGHIFDLVVENEK